MTRPFDQHVILTTAAAVLSRAFEAKVRCRLLHIIGNDTDRNRLIRCALLDAGPDMPATVMIKRSNTGQGMGLDDWAGLQFVTERVPDVPIVPHFYGGDTDEELVVMEDLSDHEGTLRHFLFAQDAVLATTILVESMAVIGIMHAATIGRHHEDQQLRDHLGPHPDTSFPAHRMLGDLALFPAVASCLGVACTTDAHSELDRALIALREPGPFHAYTSGDIAPVNLLRHQGRMRLYDFEMGAYRHALIDGVYPHIRYLSSSDAGCLPPHVKQQAEAAYRRELVKGCPAAADDTLFAQAIVTASAGWMAVRTVFLPRVLDEDIPWKAVSHRQRVLGCLDEFALLTETSGYMQALGAVARAMHLRLRSRWSRQVEPIPYFPAFQSLRV